MTVHRTEFETFPVPGRRLSTIELRGLEGEAVAARVKKLGVGAVLLYVRPGWRVIRITTHQWPLDWAPSRVTIVVEQVTRPLRRHALSTFASRTRKRAPRWQR